MDLSAGTLVTSMMVSTVGFGLFLFGKKQLRFAHLAAGVAMMIYPYFIGDVALSLGLAGALLGGVWIASRAGM